MDDNILKKYGTTVLLDYLKTRKVPSPLEAAAVQEVFKGAVELDAITLGIGKHVLNCYFRQGHLPASIDEKEVRKLVGREVCGWYRATRDPLEHKISTEEAKGLRVEVYASEIGSGNGDCTTLYAEDLSKIVLGA